MNFLRIFKMLCESLENSLNFVWIWGNLCKHFFVLLLILSIRCKFCYIVPREKKFFCYEQNRVIIHKNGSLVDKIGTRTQLDKGKIANFTHNDG